MEINSQSQGASRRQNSAARAQKMRGPASRCPRLSPTRLERLKRLMCLMRLLSLLVGKMTQVRHILSLAQTSYQWHVSSSTYIFKGHKYTLFPSHGNTSYTALELNSWNFNSAPRKISRTEKQSPKLDVRDQAMRHTRSLQNTRLCSPSQKNREISSINLHCL